MARRNGGTIGNLKSPTSTTANGFWALSDVQQNLGSSKWPSNPSLTFKIWGSAGYGGGTTQCVGAPGLSGATGGYVEATSGSITSGSTLYIYVGTGGTSGGPSYVGGGGSGAGYGGGASYIYLNGVRGTGTLLAVAGAGGARGGAGGGSTGQDKGNSTGGSQSAGGTGGTGGFGGAGPAGNGGFLSGGYGSACSGAGGGSGYYGGGGGSGDCGACYGDGGSGGSSYYNPSYLSIIHNLQGNNSSSSSGTVSPMANNVDYVAGVNAGVSAGNGGNGLIVIYVNGTKQSFTHVGQSDYYYTLAL